MQIKPKMNIQKGKKVVSLVACVVLADNGLVAQAVTLIKHSALDNE